MIELRRADESNTARHQYRRPNFTDVCAARWTRRAPICELRPWAILYRAQPSRPKAACLTDGHHRRRRCCVRESFATQKMSNTKHIYEVRPRKDRRGIDLVSDALPFGGLWYAEPNAVANAIGYAKHRSRSHDAVIRVYDET